ncbi:MAG: siderophore-interacting protein, partial [Sphingobacterium sp.]
MKPNISRYIFRVTGKETITPHYIRVKLRADQEIDFHQCTPGVNNKIFIPPHGSDDVHFAVFNKESNQWVAPEEKIKPFIRTYTHRAWNAETKEISIDFVNHGDNGPASAWANKAADGDQLGVAMKVGERTLCPAVDWYFLIGDATAIPVLSCILESLPKTAKGHCLIEVATEADIHPEISHEGFTIQWLFNEHPEKGSELSQTAKTIQLPEIGSKFAYIACEFDTVRSLRKYFRQEQGWQKEELYAFSYWRAGVAEDKSAQSRREDKE